MYTTKESFITGEYRIFDATGGQVAIVFRPGEGVAGNKELAEQLVAKLNRE